MEKPLIHDLMDRELWKSPNGRWTIASYYNYTTKRRNLKVYSETGRNVVEYPVFYPHTCTVGWDNPYRVPAYVRDRTEKMLKTYNF